MRTLPVLVVRDAAALVVAHRQRRLRHHSRSLIGLLGGAMVCGVSRGQQRTGTSATSIVSGSSAAAHAAARAHLQNGGEALTAAGKDAHVAQVQVPQLDDSLLLQRRQPRALRHLRTAFAMSALDALCHARCRIHAA